MARPQEENQSALWLDSARASFRVGPASAAVPGPGEVVIRACAVAVNPIDAMGGMTRRFVLPWLRYPTVIGSDVAGEIVAVGSAVDHLKVGNRVVGYAVGQEKNRNNPAEGAFQTHVVLLQHMCSPLPETISFEAAAVLPLGITTAAAGLFERDQLALELPTAAPRQRQESVVIFGGATSVGTNAIQLARNCGYDVIATSSPKNFPLLRRLGARAVVDYHDRNVVYQISQHLQGQYLAGTLAIVGRSLRDAIALNTHEAVTGTGRVASTQPSPDTRIRAALARRKRITVSVIWGGSPKDSAVGPAIWNAFLPDALAGGRYHTAPEPHLTGNGLAAIPAALDQLRRGVSATKLVVLL